MRFARIYVIVSALSLFCFACAIPLPYDNVVSSRLNNESSAPAQNQGASTHLVPLAPLVLTQAHESSGSSAHHGDALRVIFRGWDLDNPNGHYNPEIDKAARDVVRTYLWRGNHRYNGQRTVQFIGHYPLDFIDKGIDIAFDVYDPLKQEPCTPWCHGAAKKKGGLSTGSLNKTTPSTQAHASSGSSAHHGDALQVTFRGWDLNEPNGHYNPEIDKVARDVVRTYLWRGNHCYHGQRTVQFIGHFPLDYIHEGSDIAFEVYDPLEKGPCTPWCQGLATKEEGSFTGSLTKTTTSRRTWHIK
ncbi:hypothetical protein F5876DRAFT_80698 [Lentinula aff. lateritia]|uniref:Uncharacterized protein n=1 Tax=Lentinula aff. lateritia TaxID=2804960 RepID=A0ACC1TNW8_9AGAR|nr:hypothetical protein F5876DRAFT_80698 [Lentinula aff. lateritia]